jgi:hypothetical protein
MTRTGDRGPRTVPNNQLMGNAFGSRISDLGSRNLVTRTEDRGPRTVPNNQLMGTAFGSRISDLGSRNHGSQQT